MGKSDSQVSVAAGSKSGRSSLGSRPQFQKEERSKPASDWPMLWPMLCRCAATWVKSQPIIARSTIKGSSNRKLRVWPFATENPTTCLRRNPTVETRSQPAPMRLSNAYFSILLSRHSYRKFNNIRVPGVAHNPKVVGSNPTPATNQINKLRETRNPIKSPLSPNRIWPLIQPFY